jgi:hypothetical protein
MAEQKNEFIQSWRQLKEWGRLYIENIKLLSIEKMTILLSYGVMGALLIFFGAFALLFISVAIVLVLAQVIPLMWCFLIMGGIYLLLGVVMFLSRRSLFLDPIARFLSKLFLEHPDSNVDKPENSAKS